MSKKLFYQLTGQVLDGVVHLSFYQSTEVFKSKSMVLDTCFKIYRKEETDFTFGKDYEEFFDYKDADLIFSGNLELINKRKYQFQDRQVSIGKVYTYWVCTDQGELPYGPCFVKVRDQNVWWSYQKINQYMEQIQKDFADLVLIKEFGTTSMKKRLKGFIAGNQDAPIAFVGTIHAGESGPELFLPVIRKLLENDKELLNKVGVAILPSVNMDERERLVKGCPYYLRTNANGVDINRNFDADWDSIDYTYGYDTSQHGCQTFRGPYANSEDETRAVINFVDEVKPRAVFSCHCLASICDDAFYTALSAKNDIQYIQKCAPLLNSYKSGFRNRNCEADLGFICTEGSLPAFAYQKYAIPCFDVEYTGDEEGKCCLTDQTTLDVLEVYQERHYQGLRKLLVDLASSC